VEACLPKDEAGNFIASQEKSDVVHDLLAFLAEKMLEMNKQKQQEIKGFLGWLESYLGIIGGGAHAQDQIAKLLRARLRWLFGGAQEEPQETASRSGQTGAGRSPQSRVRGLDGQTAALEGADPGKRTS